MVLRHRQNWFWWAHLNALVGLISEALTGDKTDTAIKGLGAIGVPFGPVNTLYTVYGTDHVEPHGPKIGCFAVA
jgi:hypothetical protein